MARRAVTGIVAVEVVTLPDGRAYPVVFHVDGDRARAVYVGKPGKPERVKQWARRRSRRRHGRRRLARRER